MYIMYRMIMIYMNPTLPACLFVSDQIGSELVTLGFTKVEQTPFGLQSVSQALGALGDTLCAKKWMNYIGEGAVVRTTSIGMTSLV